MEIQISVRGLVEFLLRSGDIDNRKKSVSENAMLEGSRVHRMIQKSMGPEYHSEVPLSYSMQISDYTIVIDGRADGVIDGDCVTIDEIKGTYKKLDSFSEPVPIHLAQAKCYAYFYASRHSLKEIKTRMTYCNLDTEAIRYFYQKYSIEELEKWFQNLIDEYVKWTNFQVKFRKKRQESLKRLPFPFPYREGQKELAANVYRTIVHNKKLFLEAPTGVGKTLSTVFPALKALGEKKAERVFYLTAKTVTATVAEDTFSLLRKKGLLFKTLTVTAKEKICFMEETNCNPEDCPYARGHFDRINDAMFDMLTNEDHFSREKVERYAQKHRVCPFELSLDMSLFSDGIICDYNYVFDPHVYLKRFFSEGKNEKYIFLIDEAHNLVDRGREMYSAALVKEDFLEIKKIVKVYDKKLAKKIEACNHLMLLWKKECTKYRIYEDISCFLQKLDLLYSGLSDYLENHDDSPVRDAVLEFYFKVAHFQLIASDMEEGYVKYSSYDSAGNFYIRLFNVNPSKKLKQCMEWAVSSILFSATLLPVQYYKRLLGGDSSDYEIYASSTFREEQKGLFIGTDITSKYTERSARLYKTVAEYLHEVVMAKRGNYMAFFPSHAFLKAVYREYEGLYGEEKEIECLIQSEHMDEMQRSEFITSFMGNQELDFSTVIQMKVEMEEEVSLLGFCVMGGIFAEGIDLRRDSLIGAIIVGTGIPMVCLERELIKRYFDLTDESGYAYAYLYPGMNKVLQAAGRVIRTAEDRGIIVLLDYRFLQESYQRLFPREWEHFERVSVGNIKAAADRFWNNGEEN